MFRATPLAGFEVTPEVFGLRFLSMEAGDFSGGGSVLP